MLPTSAAAQSVHDHGVVELKYLNYRDWQPGADRMTVQSPTLYALVPIDDTLEVEGSVVYDAMSGASPLFFNALSGASHQGCRRLPDRRRSQGRPSTSTAGRFPWAASPRRSRIIFRAGRRIDVRIFSDDRNHDLRVRLRRNERPHLSHQRCRSNAPRNTLEFLVGITQALSPTSIVNSNITYSHGHGYYDDPYKTFDHRPSERNVFAWLTRYNEYFEKQDATLRLSYR